MSTKMIHMSRTGAPEVSAFYASEAWPSLEPSLGNSGTYGELRPHGVRQLLEREAALKQMGVDIVQITEWFRVFEIGSIA